jgi:hypothetical protein
VLLFGHVGGSAILGQCWSVFVQLPLLTVGLWWAPLLIWSGVASDLHVHFS